MHTTIIAEIGINHNGDISIAKKLIDIAQLAGCDIVKFQKRTVNVVYTSMYLDGFRESPWGTTQREQKEGLEFSEEEYDEINAYCKYRGISWTASAWDIGAQKFLKKYDLTYNKIASALLVDEEILNEVASEGKYTFISTGMSTLEEIDNAVEIFKNHKCSFELMQCNSTYPMPAEDANLKLIRALSERYGNKVGYSGHEAGTLISTCAVAAGATSIERQITLDKTMYGSDQGASLEPGELFALVKQIRLIEKALGTGEKTLTKTELATKAKLRG